jgi:predicted ATP-grasp superfamily ATP-dependent carboligase
MIREVDSDATLAPPVRRWLNRVRVHTAPPVVLLGGSCNALSFARSLGRRGVPVLMLETNPMLGIYTRYADVQLLPDVRQRPDVWLQLLQSIGRSLERSAVLFSTCDGHSQLIAQNAPKLEGCFRFCIPDAATLNRIHNKRLQYDFAAAAGISIPAVYFPASLNDVRSILPHLQFPTILKPYDSDESRRKLKKKLLVATTAEELIASYQRMTAMTVPVIIQELIRGDDSEIYGYFGFWDRDGRERAWVTRRKLRQYPPGTGDGSLQVTVDEPQILELSRRLLRVFGFRGFAGVEFKRHPSDGTFRLIEINARTESGNQLAISAGVDLPWIGYQYLTGEKLPVEPICPSRHVKYVNEEWDVQTFMILRRNSTLSFRSWLASICDAEALAIWAIDDPKPFAMGIARALQTFASRRREE